MTSHIAYTLRTRASPGAEPMTLSMHSFAEGDRVAAASRPGFPSGTVLKLMEQGFLLVRWDSDVLETAHHRELIRAESAGL